MTPRSSGPTRVPDLTLERYRLGELPPDERTLLEQHLRVDDELRQRLQKLEASDEEIRRQYPPDVLAARVRQQLGARRAAAAPQTAGTGLFVMRWSTVAALASVVLLAVLAGPTLLGPRDESTDRIKGLEPTLLLFRKTPQGSELLQDGAVVRAGELVRIGYRPAGQAWGVIVSVDGRGVVTQHLPRSGAQAARLPADSQVLLDSAYELDDAPRWERFYFVAGSAPFDATPVIEAARKAAASGDGPSPVLSLHMNVKQSSVLLRKQVAP